VSGIGELAENIVTYRSETVLSKTENNSKKCLVWAKSIPTRVAFIRISNAKNPLDNSAVHPEAYNCENGQRPKIDRNDLIANKEKHLIKPEITLLQK
jgi:uncharacterized protein